MKTLQIEYFDPDQHERLGLGCVSSKWKILFKNVNRLPFGFFISFPSIFQEVPPYLQVPMVLCEFGSAPSFG
jgi:hypothetical protein